MLLSAAHGQIMKWKNKNTLAKIPLNLYNQEKRTAYVQSQGEFVC